MEKHTGLLHCNISRTEHGHTVPSLSTLEKCAKAFAVPLYKLFHEGDEPPVLPNLSGRSALHELAEGKSAKESAFLRKLFKSLGLLTPTDQELFLHVTRKLASR